MGVSLSGVPLIKLAVLPNVNCDKMHSCRIRLARMTYRCGRERQHHHRAGRAQRLTAGLRQRKKDSSRRAIEDAAWELFAEQGYEETSINDIAERANVAPRTFFRYFPTKEAVMYPQFEELLAVGARRVPQATRRRAGDHQPVRELRGAGRFARGRGVARSCSAWR